jgi:hypothetical protein
MFSMRFWLAFVLIILGTFGVSLNIVEGKARRILLDTDVDTDDFFALLYLLKLNRSEFKLEVSKIKQSYLNLLFLSFVLFIVNH